PAVANIGSIVTVTLEPAQFNHQTQSAYYFIFGGTTQAKSPYKVNDTTYLLEVPSEGPVEGKIAFTIGGYWFYSDQDFLLASEGYCENTGTMPNVPISKPLLRDLMIQGESKPLTLDTYKEYTNDPIQLQPGQSLRLGIRGDNTANQTKIYIDWNADKNFDEPSYLMSEGVPDSMVNVVLTVPSSMVPGTQTKLRIVTGGGSIDMIKACGLTYNGQVIDYPLHIVPPSNNFKIIDFFPSIATDGTSVTLTGDNLQALQSVTLNGLSIPLGSGNSHTRMMYIPEGATTGQLVFHTANESLTSFRTLVIDNTIRAPGSLINDEITSQPSSFRYIYKATLNGESIPFWYYIDDVNFRIEPKQEFP
ncbi:MAG: GEVED domain-containing protein, partial [Cyclobacteriaceae bacterium]|nr:GEVED domain-containing protein [Cyclobacteriaceae bacterium]